MPMSEAFAARLTPMLPQIAKHFGTPFHIYDEQGIRDTGAALRAAFGHLPGFQEFFAVKALPNPHILKLIKDMGFGFDCSSAPELTLATLVGASGNEIMFTSNNTTRGEFHAALESGCLINLDDIGLLTKLPQMPELVCFRYNPGNRRTGNAIIGNPVESKFGVSHEYLISAYRRAKEMGARRFGLHTMLVSSELNYEYMLDTTVMLLDMAVRLHSNPGIQLDFINIGGGFGVPYRPDEAPLDLTTLAQGITRLLRQFRQDEGYAPMLYMENGRYMTAPHGILVTKVINRKKSYRTYVGVDANMSALMRPAIYGAYHHMTVYGKKGRGTEVVDVVGALCENNDKFAIQRALPPVTEGDLLMIHDTGAHGHAMGFNYNARLRPQELLLQGDGRVRRIRRAETFADYTATLDCDPAPWSAGD